MSDVEEWGIVECLGHRQRAGRISEVERFGGKMLRVDVPVEPTLLNPAEYVTEFYASAALYAVRPTSEAVARAAARRMMDPRPVQPTSYRMARLAGPGTANGDDGEIDEEDQA